MHCACKLNFDKILHFYLFSVLSKWSNEGGKLELKSETYIDGMNNSPDEKYPPVLVPLTNWTLAQYTGHAFPGGNSSESSGEFHQINCKK